MVKNIITELFLYNAFIHLACLHLLARICLYTNIDSYVSADIYPEDSVYFLMAEVNSNVMC